MPNYYLGIDVSKGYADFIMLDESKQSLEEGFQLDDTYGGHLKLFEYLKDFLSCRPQAVIYVGVESTGGYENNWYNHLVSIAQLLPIHIARLNPFRVKSNSEAGAKYNKTDQISAGDIAEYLINHPQKIRYDEDQSYSNLRRQWNLIKLNLKQHAQLLNHLESLLYTSMPELLTFCRNGIPGWLFKLLLKYPTYEALLAAGVEELAKIPYVSRKRAYRIIQLAENGIGCSDPVSGQLISTVVKQIFDLNQQIRQQKKFVEGNYQEAQEQVDLLTTFKGIGVYSAVGLLLNIVSVERFSGVKKLSAYFGVHPVYKQSGDGIGGFRMSKQGRSEPRAILYMVALSAIQHNPVIKELYGRCLHKGMNRSQALGVCMHKILRIVYGMLKNNTPFDPRIDQRNREKNKSKTSKDIPESPKKRRFQSFDKKAPISRRQFKKRKEQTLSQDE